MKDNHNESYEQVAIFVHLKHLSGKATDLLFLGDFFPYQFSWMIR